MEQEYSCLNGGLGMELHGCLSVPKSISNQEKGHMEVQVLGFPSFSIITSHRPSQHLFT